MNPNGESMIDQAIPLVQAGRFGEALPLLRRAIDEDRSNWNAEYLAGQCCRFLGDVDGAIVHLRRADELHPDQPPVLLALGVAFQQTEQWPSAIESFARAIEIDPEYELAYNSLAMTRKMSGELEKALHDYDAGAKALARRIVGQMHNDAANPILKHRDTAGHLWLEYAMWGGTYLASSAEGITSIGWPTGASAEEEERTERHAGLYWMDRTQAEGGTVRVFLPNYFNTFREALRSGGSYANLIGNRGTVLDMLGRPEEAAQHFAEATEFSQGGV